MNRPTIKAAQLMEALRSVPCDAEVYLSFDGGDCMPLHQITLHADSQHNLTPGQPKNLHIVTYVALACFEPTEEPVAEPKGNPNWN